MLKKLLPVLFLIVGTGAGVGAGLFLSPKDTTDAHAKPASDGHGAADDGHDSGHDEKAKDDGHGSSKGDDHGEGHGDSGSFEYVRLNNQFVIPVVQKDRMSSLVVMSLSLEAEYGMRETVYEREPRLRDAFLQVLFDHANMGGFDGAFTRPEALDPLRSALLDVAQQEFGKKIATVLIIDIARQDS